MLVQKDEEWENFSLLFYFYVLKLWRGEQRGGKFLNSKIKDESVDFLFQAVLSLKTVEECYNFFEDLCTINELLSLGQRFEVANMLRNHRTYNEVAEETGASTATISRVNRCLNYGTDGYDLVIRRLKEREEQQED